MRRSRLVCAIGLLAAAACSSNTACTSRTEATEPRAPTSAQAPATQATQAQEALTPDMAAPYFADGVARQAAERFALEDWRAARDGFAAHLDATHEPPLSEADRGRARLMMAIADTHLGEWSRAAAGFAYAAVRLPLIADYIDYQAARAYYFAHDSEPAMTHARKVAPTAITGAEAALLIGDLLRGAGRHDEMAAHYQRYLSEHPQGMRRAEARYRLAQAQEALGDTATALAHYRRITIHAPLSQWAELARQRMDALLPTQPEAARARLTVLTAPELIARGMVYYDAMRNPLAEADFASALAAPGLTEADRCVAAYHRANSVYKARDRKRAAPLFDETIATCRQAGNVDLHVKAAYQAGRSYSFIGEHQTAIDRYAQSEKVSAAHSFVDDARLRQAEEHASLGNDDDVTKLLASIPDAYPQGDMRAEAMWRLAWRAYQEGRYEEAIGWLRKQIATKPIDNNYWAEGQAQYWIGRSYARLGRAAESVAAYREAITTYPLSYYTLLALNRLREEHPATFAEVSEQLRTPPADYDPEQPAFHFQARPAYQSPGFARALELLRLGLGDPAGAELRRLGMSAPGHRDEITDPDHVERLWASVFLYDRAGQHATSHWPTRWNILDYKRQWPVGHNQARWHIAYPRAFWDLVDQHARQHGFPTALLMAIMREESAFNPLLESYANAIGLTQLIFPTAERFARGTGIAVSRETLRDPDKNVTIGARFLGFLWSKWSGHVPLVPASYNAGENAVARWLKARGTLASDEWIESIVDDQPRGYSKRVIASYFTYAYLYGGEIPIIPNTIPPRLIP